jgi:predicted nucleotidyltransferase
MSAAAYEVAHTVRISAEVLRVVREFQRRLAARFGGALRDVRIFGSYARGAAHEESDVDVFVLLDRVDYRRQRAVLDIAVDLFAETSFLISPTIYGEIPFLDHLAQQRPLANEIQREGIRP